MHIINILKHQTWSLASFIPGSIIKFNYIWATIQVLKNFYLSEDFTFANWFEHFNTYLLFVLSIHTLKDLRVFTPAYLCCHSVVINRIPINLEVINL
jgi:hypothetical protein